MLTKRQKHKKVSKQVRIPISLHKRLKIEAAKNGITVIKLLDDLLSNYYEKWDS